MLICVGDLYVGTVYPLAADDAFDPCGNITCESFGQLCVGKI